MYCRNCGEALNANQAICLKCGVEVGNGKSFCQNCGKPVNENAAVCLNCGCKIEDKKDKENAQYLNGKDKILIALMCFFFGAIGVHNFMMGETKRGILKIVLFFLCGISGIWALVDLIMILCDTYKVSLG